MPIPKYYVRPDGLHESIITVNGKRKAFRGKTDREVWNKIKAYRAEAEKPKTVPFSDVAHAWWNEIEPTLAPNSLRNYSPADERAVAQFGPEDVATITSKEIETYINQFAKTHAKKTVITQRQIIRQINRQYTTEPLKNPDYGKIINEKHFRRLLGLINKEKVVAGGNYNEGTLQIEPTVLDNVTFEDAVMQEEIFGPLLPIITYDSIDEAIEKINSMAHPLAVYVFTSRGRLASKVMERCDFGGGCINDTLIHLATSEMGFGGFGESGMGAYHGEEGFRTFTHYKSIVNKKTWPDLSIRYQPYNPKNEKKLRKFLK